MHSDNATHNCGESKHTYQQKTCQQASSPGVHSSREEEVEEVQKVFEREVGVAWPDSEKLHFHHAFCREEEVGEDHDLHFELQVAVGEELQNNF